MRTDTAGATSDRGAVRTENQDDFYVGEDLWIVADGMGGHDGGQAASFLATITASQALVHAGGRDPAAVRSAITLAHRITVAAGDEVAPGMGTTIVVAARQSDGRVTLGWVGDSRAYLLREGALRQVTSDHNEAGRLLAQGKITPQQAACHPGRHVLTEALGCGHHRPPTVDTVVIPGKGRLLLCSDGLNGELSTDQIRNLLGEKDPQAACDALVAAAGRRRRPRQHHRRRR